MAAKYCDLILIWLFFLFPGKYTSTKTSYGLQQPQFFGLFFFSNKNDSLEVDRLEFQSFSSIGREDIYQSRPKSRGNLLTYLAWPFTILQNDNIMISWDFFRLTALRCPGMAAGAVRLRKSHDIVILSFCNIVKGQAKYCWLR